jgi:uncharacterized integral membrane protein (TIGR00697 family)
MKKEFWFIFCAGLSVGLLVVSNVAATKLVNFFGVMVDGGIVSFPLAFVLADVIVEVYGARRARYIIYVGFLVNLVAVMMLGLVQVLPAGAGWGYQEDFEHVLGFLPRVVAGSLVSYLVSELLNVAVFGRIRRATGAKWLWARTLGSSVVANVVNSLVFCGVVFVGVVTGAEWWGMVGVSCGLMIFFEVVLTPVTYLGVRWLRGRVVNLG